MARFSDRIGLTRAHAILQTDSMNDDLRNSLWNALAVTLADVHAIKDEYDEPTEGYYFVARLWLDYFKKPLDDMPDWWRDALKVLKLAYTKAEWFEVYNFVEAVVESLEGLDKNYRTERGPSFRNLCNRYLEREMAGYRVIGSHVVAITSEAEIQAVEEALTMRDRFRPISTHLATAVALMSDKKNPDYRNSIKESISAVEAACQLITGDPKSTLGQALKALESKNVNIHPSLRLGFDKLYGWTSDAGGIRHAILEESTLRFDDAKFMLVACSAFVNFLKASAPTGE